MGLISIVTVNFNQHQATLELLKSIEQHYPKANIEIILVDNGSDIDNGALFKTTFPNILYIRSAQNLGFAGGNNLGVKQSSGEYLFFVNNDTEFSAGLLEALSGTLANNPLIGVVSPQINYFDDQTIVQYAGFTRMNYYTCRNHCVGQFETDQGQYRNRICQTGYAHGAAMMVRRDAMDKTGLMAENFFLYYEEMDWCDRIKRAGYEIWINTSATIYHKESLSVGKNSALKEYFMNRNRILFIRRNAKTHQQLFFFLYFITFVTPRNILKYLTSGTPGFVKVLLRAINWNLSHNTNSTDLGYQLK
ncbi:MAG TPA: glycosyltransferase family 2 protein [Pedobacter sp.]|uniref:glycosyltransferase family 2 protein n=1 Tax=Pedobacter sp. TaxID=1411316 RepID=UPI002C1F871A|nr:glycosyltransferase family 2 protein [Pedobacter sp.]HMI02545.1 glycosyltransferase family 2 protein [Pedobacter sp.]